MNVHLLITFNKDALYAWKLHFMIVKTDATYYNIYKRVLLIRTNWFPHQLPSNTRIALVGNRVESHVTGFEGRVNFVDYWGLVVNILLSKSLEWNEYKSMAKAMQFTIYIQSKYFNWLGHYYRIE